MEATEEVAVAKNLGLGDITFFSKIGYGGGGGCGTIGHLSLAIAGGVSHVGVAWRSRKRGSGVRTMGCGSGRSPDPRFRAGHGRHVGSPVRLVAPGGRDRNADDAVHARTGATREQSGGGRDVDFAPTRIAIRPR